MLRQAQHEDVSGFQHEDICGLQHDDICGLQPEPVEGFHCPQLYNVILNDTEKIPSKKFPVFSAGLFHGKRLPE
jgi:hypothetical protein